jgi:Domain of unknown function (DUF4148)
MTFRRIATALTAVVAVASGTAAMAQDISLSAFDAKLANAPVTSTTRAEVLADLQNYRASGLLELQRGEAPDLASPQYLQAQAKYAQLSAGNTSNAAMAKALPTRAEVVADLALYRASGLLDLQRGEQLDIASPQYQAAQAKYLQLRSAALGGTSGERVSATSPAADTAVRMR